MVGAISVENANVRLKNVKITGFDTAIAAKNSSLNMSDMTFDSNSVALDLERSPTTIINSQFINNRIDLIVDSTPLYVIDSILKNIISRVDSMPFEDVRTNPYKVKAQAKEALRTSDGVSKRTKFIGVIKTVKEYAGYATTFYALFQLIMYMLGG
ncbi:MAG: hypothetical protein GEU26_01730 [Nitrososphaeraceae archaeon]|nr:hypothetical protein [Nitrososphaeraceae archaeon]